MTADPRLDRQILADPDPLYVGSEDVVERRRWPDRDHLRRMSNKAVNAYFASLGLDVRVRERRTYPLPILLAALVAGFVAGLLVARIVGMGL